jgi:hypothetical protein
LLDDKLFLELENVAGHLLFFTLGDVEIDITSVVKVRNCVLFLTQFAIRGDHASLVVLVDCVDPSAQEVALFLWSDGFGQVKDLVHFLPVFLPEVHIHKLFSAVFGLILKRQGSMN